tara:strand:+ start:159 stop:335 length:177 start_codon:yes stop_codon:yes gene_type:complete
MTKFVRRPVDLGTAFKQYGMTLITDPASDRYLNDHPKLATSQQERTETKVETSSSSST